MMDLLAQSGFNAARCGGVWTCLPIAWVPFAHVTLKSRTPYERIYTVPVRGSSSDCLNHWSNDISWTRTTTPNNELANSDFSHATANPYPDNPILLKAFHSTVIQLRLSYSPTLFTSPQFLTCCKLFHSTFNLRP